MKIFKKIERKLKDYKYRSYRRRKDKEIKAKHNECVKVAKLGGYTEPKREGLTSEVEIYSSNRLPLQFDIIRHGSVFKFQERLSNSINELRDKHPDAIDFKVKRIYDDSHLIYKIIPITDEDYQEVCVRHLAKWQRLQTEISEFNKSNKGEQQ